MPTQELADTTALVTGASRGFGRSISIALAKAGARVVGVARDREALAEVRAQIGDSFVAVTADVTDPVTAGQLIDQYRPRTLVLNAGAVPLSRPLHHHTWETFSRNWDVDVKQAFHWSREALLTPLDPGSVVISFSSGAALRGSPVSGGYAGAKATIKFIASYAADESQRADLGIRFVAVLPKLTPTTGHGAIGVAAYAKRMGVTVEQFLENFGETVDPELVGKAVVDVATDAGLDSGAYLLHSADGLHAV